MTEPQWAALLDCVKDVPRSNLANAAEVIHHSPLYGPDKLWHDTFLDRLMTADSPAREWRDDDDTKATIYMQQDVGMRTVSTAHVAAAAAHIGRQRARHCVREAIQAHPWDREPRIALAFEAYWGIEPGPGQSSAYIRAVSANFFLGMIARVFSPGCQLDTMVVFEGAQGIGKSRALRALGGDWYMLAAEPVTSKDFFQALPGKWLIEIGELEAFSKAERERIKLAISTPSDRYRGSYDRRSSDHPRQCVFAGTTNRDDWGNDDTGLRRFWPVHCTVVDIPGILAHRADWFTEAFALFRHGATWWDTPVNDTLLVQQDRQYHDPWTDVVLDWCATRQGLEETTVSDIARGALSLRDADITRSEQNRIGSILRLAGWLNHSVRRSGRQVRIWLPPT